MQNHDIHIYSMMHIFSVFINFLNECSSIHSNLSIFQIIRSRPPFLNYKAIIIQKIIEYSLKLFIFRWRHENIKIIVPRYKTSMANSTKSSSTHNEINNAIISTKFINKLHYFQNFILYFFHFSLRSSHFICHRAFILSRKIVDEIPSV